MKHKHHIIPRHAGGTDDPFNLVELTVEEHAEAHRILFEQHGRWQDKTAWMALSNQIGKEEIIKEVQRNTWLGKKRSPESREKMAAAKRGKKISEEHKKALNEGRRNSKNSPEHNEILRNVWLGKKHSPETLEKIKISRAWYKPTEETKEKQRQKTIEKYKDPIEKQKHSERMKLWWNERRKVGT